MIYTKSELLDILEQTGYKAFWVDAKKTTKPHFIVSVVYDNIRYADDTIHDYDYNIQILFATKSKTSGIDNFMKSNLKASFTTDYDSDKEWYIYVYTINALISDL